MLGYDSGTLSVAGMISLIVLFVLVTVVLPTSQNLVKASPSRRKTNIGKNSEGGFDDQWRPG